MLRYKLATPHAYAPLRGSVLAAGVDLKSAYHYTVPPRGKTLVSTDLIVEVPEGCYGRIAPRSGLAAGHFIDIGAGVIDRDYRGIVHVLMFNHADEPFYVCPGMRIAQLICERIVIPDLQQVTVLSPTERNKSGFGSTGT